MTDKGQKENDREKIRKLFKHMLEIAAMATEEKNPEVSIVLDGVVLAIMWRQ